MTWFIWNWIYILNVKYKFILKPDPTDQLTGFYMRATLALNGLNLQNKRLKNNRITFIKQHAHFISCKDKKEIAPAIWICQKYHIDK